MPGARGSHTSLLFWVELGLSLEKPWESTKRHFEQCIADLPWQRPHLSHPPPAAAVSPNKKGLSAPVAAEMASARLASGLSPRQDCPLER